jgi:hypothetical protein
VADGSTVLVAVMGRYGSDPAEPFPPRLEAVGIDIDFMRSELTEALRAAWESTAPWEPRSLIEEKGARWVGDALKRHGYVDVQIQVSVIDDLPFTTSSDHGHDRG